MAKRMRENIEFICMIIAVLTAVVAMAYKSHDIDANKKAITELRLQSNQDHDVIQQMSTDVKWIKKRLE